jgi:hypothetical protein
VVISRLLFGRGEPSSIFEHIDAHVRPGVPGLTEGGDDLPDERAPTRGDLAVAAGVTDTVATEDDLEAVEQIYRALAALARKPSQPHRKRMRELFREGRVRARIDPLRDRLSAESPPNAVELYPELKELFLRSGYRDEVKYAIALLAGFGRPEDADPLRVIARHDEFTMYAAVALASVTPDPVEEWLGLLEHVSEAGRTELSELILREPRSEAVRERLVRDGLGQGNAMTLARGCRLDEILARETVDVAVLAGARAIVDELVLEPSPPYALTAYEHAGAAVEGLVRHLGERPQGVAEYLSCFWLRNLLLRAELAAEFEACGLDGDRRASVVAACGVVLGDASWSARAAAALQSDDALERWRGMEVAEHLGVDLHSYVLEKLPLYPYDHDLWARLVVGAGEERVREAVELAGALWDFGDIARGPALDLSGDGPLDAVGPLLRELVRYPGVGGALLEASLQSPIVGNRLMALIALSHWESIPPEILGRVARARERDPDPGVREHAAAVLSGDPIPEG